MRTHTAAASLLFLFLLASPGAPAAEPTHDSGAEAGDPRTVLVELFTSQGCSSCPLADELLGRLVRVQPIRSAKIVAVSQHVDYWDDLGWRDPFSDPAFTARQREYGEQFDGNSIYTPQMIVDGAAELVGSDEAAALAAIARAARRPKLEIDLARSSGGQPATLRVAVPPLPGDAAPADVWLAVTEDGLATDVASGENGGRRLEHTGVARSLRRIGSADGDGYRGEVVLELDPAWNVTHLAAVVFVQDRSGRAVRGVASISLKD